jgi:hypothetical protein
MNKLTVVTIAFALFLYTVSFAVLSRGAAPNAGAAQEPILAISRFVLRALRGSPGSFEHHD